MFNRKLKEKIAMWFDYSNSELSNMDKRITKLETKIDKLPNNQIHNPEKQRK